MEILISQGDEIQTHTHTHTRTHTMTKVCVVIVMASDSQIKACRQAGKVWRGKLLFGVSFHVASGQMEGEKEIE